MASAYSQAGEGRYDSAGNKTWRAPSPHESASVHVVGDISGLSPASTDFTFTRRPISAIPRSRASAGTGIPARTSTAARNRRTPCGDLGNIEADSMGRPISIKPSRDFRRRRQSVVAGHSIVVHAKEDDLQTDPSATAGAAPPAQLRWAVKVGLISNSQIETGAQRARRVFCWRAT